jgi:hypothetical protein
MYLHIFYGYAPVMWEIEAVWLRLCKRTCAESSWLELASVSLGWGRNSTPETARAMSFGELLLICTFSIQQVCETGSPGTSLLITS